MFSSTTLAIILIAALLALSAVFSASETGLTSAAKARLHRLAEQGNKRAQRVLKLREDPESLIGGILLGSNVINTLATAIATSVLLTAFGENGVTIATAVMTVALFIFTDVLPKSYAIAMPDRVALAVVPFISWVVRMLGPVLTAVRFIVRQTLMLFGVDVTNADHALSPSDELRGAIDLQVSEGGMVKADRDMLGAVLDLDEVTVEDVMIHRKHMRMLNVADRPSDIISAVIRSPFTRLPVYEDNPENIIGILHAKSVLAALRDPKQRIADIDFRTIMQPPWFIPETTTLREQLNAFLSRHVHFALVVDEYGGLQGMLTLEDILEEIVGDIKDEHDRKVEGVEELEDGRYLMDGRVTIRDLNRRFGWALPDDDATTVAGLVIYAAERIPIVGETFVIAGRTFEVAGRRRNQITRIRVTG